MSHFATAEFWTRYQQLPPEIRELADKNFALLKRDPRHPSLRLKKVGSLWFWIGHHGQYEQLLNE